MPQLPRQRQRSRAYRRHVQTFDPADHTMREAEYLKPLSDIELEKVLSSPGWSRWKGSSEYNATLKPAKCRGLWPNPGLYAGMARRDASVASALEKRARNLTALDWQIVPPAEPTDEEVYITEYMRDVFASLHGGLPGLLYQISKRDLFGFALLEMIYEIESSTGFFRLEELAYIESSTVYKWITNQAGYLVGVLQRGERGLIPIPIEKLAHFARGFTGRNWEGVSLLRSIFYAVSAKAEVCTSSQASRVLMGEGYLEVTTESEAGSPERTELEAQLNQWSEAEQRWIIIPETVTIQPRHGGSVLPPLAPDVAVYNAEISRALGAELEELATQAHGSRALGTEYRAASNQALAGEAVELSSLIHSQIIQPLCRLNGWPVERSPRIFARGIGDDRTVSGTIAKARLILEMVRDGVVTAERAAELTERALELLDV